MFASDKLIEESATKFRYTDGEELIFSQVVDAVRYELTVKEGNAGCKVFSD